MSIYPVYRDGRWQRVPMLLLVKGDLIALATGDVTPARVEPHVPGYATDLGGPISQLRVRAPTYRPKKTTHGSYGLSPVSRQQPRSSYTHHRLLSPCAGVQGEMLEAGEKVRFRSSHSEPFTRKCSLSPSSRSLLLLCGDMRCFR